MGAVFAGLFVPIALAYADDLRKDRDRGLTSKAAFVLTFLLGVLALTEHLFATLSQKLIAVSALGVAVATILSVKEPLRGFVRRLSRDDVYATMKFLVIAVIVLPLLPDRWTGPLDALNPHHIGLMIVLIAGISFVGYVLVRALGAGRGLGVVEHCSHELAELVNDGKLHHHDAERDAKKKELHYRRYLLEHHRVEHDHD